MRWTETSLTKLHLLPGAAIAAAQAMANLRSDGTMLCVSHLARVLEGKTVE